MTSFPAAGPGPGPGGTPSAPAPSMADHSHRGPDPASGASDGGASPPTCGSDGGGAEPDAPGGEESRPYRMAPLIRLTLLLLYLALVLPLPLMAPGGLRPAMALAVPAGLVLVLAATSEQVAIDRAGIRVAHPRWCRWWLRRGWSLPWSRVQALSAVPTSQGGTVYYVRARPPAPPPAALRPAATATSRQPPQTATDPDGSAASGHGQAFLLPQRVERFEEFLSRFSHFSGLDTASVRRISPAWTYRVLAALSGMLLLGELIALGQVLIIGPVDSLAGSG